MHNLGGWDFCACGWESEWVRGWPYLCSSALVCSVLCINKCMDAFCSVSVCTTELYSPFVPRSIYNTFRSRHCCVLCGDMYLCCVNVQMVEGATANTGVGMVGLIK